MLDGSAIELLVIHVDAEDSCGTSLILGSLAADPEVNVPGKAGFITGSLEGDEKVGSRNASDLLRVRRYERYFVSRESDYQPNLIK